MNTRSSHAPTPRRLALRLPLFAFLFVWIAIGHAQTYTNTVIPTNSTWRFLRGTNEPSAPLDAWRAITFDAASWELAPAPFHYGTNAVGGDDALTTGTILSDMAGQYTSIYLRRDFVLTNVESAIGMAMRLSIDDGFIVWLNGVELRRLSVASGAVSYTNTATINREPPISSVILPTVSAPQTLLQNGTNTLAVHALNGSGTAQEDFRIDPELWITMASAPTVTNVIPMGGSAVTNLRQFTVQFDLTVTNVKPTDLRINGQPASSVTAGPSANYTFSFPVPLTGPVEISWNPAQQIRTTAGGLFVATNTTWNFQNTYEGPVITSVSPTPGSDVAGFTSFAVTFSQPVGGVDVDDLLINGSPASSLGGAGASYFFTFPRPPSGPVVVTWNSSHGITNLAGITFNSTGLSYNYNVVFGVTSVTPAPGSTLASVSQVQVMFSDPIVGIEASDLLVSGQPATSMFGGGAGPYLFQFPSPPAGNVQFAFAPGNGITDLSGHALPATSWSVTLNPGLFSGDIVINEILAGNALTNSPLDLDEDNDVEPWIELYNRGTNAVRLLGWALTDDLDLPGRWTFPDVTLDPGKYLLVYASEKDRKVVGGVNALGRTNQLHTNFKLSMFGDYLWLMSPDSPAQVVDVVKYPEQRNDYSYGRIGASNWIYFATATPLATNGTSSLVQVVPKPSVNVTRGVFDQPFTLIADCELPGALMRYTTDGTPPSATVGTVYTGPIVISNTAVFRIIAYAPNAIPSRIQTHSYIFINSVIGQANSQPGLPSTWQAVGSKGSSTPSYPADYEVDPEITTNASYAALMKPALMALPVVSIALKPSDFFDPNVGIYANPDPATTDRYKWERAASAEFFVQTGDEEGFQVDCGVRMQGNASRDPSKTEKHPLRLTFKGAYGSGRLNYQIFPDSPVESFNTIVLRADFNNSWLHWDPNQRIRGTRVRDAWGKDTFRAMGQPAAHSRYVHLFLSGLYWGVYELSERADADFAANYYGGEKDQYDAIASKPTEAIDGDIVAYTAMTNFIRSRNMTVLSNYVAAMQLLDVTNFVDYMLLNFYAANQDWGYDGNWNAVRRRSPAGPFEYIVWDAERYIEGVNDNRTTANSDLPSGLHTNLIYNAEYRLLFADRVYKHCYNGGALSESQNILRWQRRAAQLDTAIVAESARWGDNRRDVMTTFGGGSAPFYLYTRNDYWKPEIDRLVGNYFTLRLPVFINQLRTTNLYPNVAPPVFNQHGGRVAPGFQLTMSGTASPIYYTTDGSDPRVWGSNTVSASAQLYTSALTLSASVTIKARALSGTNWSPLLEAPFNVGTLGSPLRITEIMYNPVGGDFYEYIEVQNTGTMPLDLSLCSFDGISFVFPLGYVLPAGQRIVLGNNSNTNAWKIRYPQATPAGWFGGSLANAGERISVLDASGGVLVSVEYDDEAGWDVLADGSGYSLEIIDTNGRADDPANWRAGNSQNGTPGAANSVAPTPAVMLNEVMAENLNAVNHAGTFPDWVELWNPGATATNIAGWSLTDDGNARKFVFPANTIIPAGGYLIVWCDAATNVTPGLHTGFALARSGEGVFLYDQSTRRVDAITFGPQVADYSIGRVSGAWRLTTPTTNAANVAALTAPPTSLFINEWLANAIPGGSDWVELFNAASDAPVALQGLYLGTSNAISQLRSLSFVPARGFVQLFADEAPGADHLAFKLSAAPSAIVLYDASGGELQRVTYGVQLEGLSQGRYPDGSANIVPFPGSMSPGASNYLNTYSGPGLNEVLARNTSQFNALGDSADFIELANTNATPFNLGGMGLSDELGQVKFRFAPNTLIAANGYLVVWCDGARAAISNGPTLVAPFSLNGNSGSVFLLSTNGQPVQSLDYGFQVADQPIGIAASGGWALLSNATPGAANAAAAALASATNVAVNEWAANPTSGDDWFELFNRGASPVALSGLFVTDDPSLAGLRKDGFGPLSFIGARSWVKLVADGARGAGSDHVSFSLNASGEVLQLTDTNGLVLDSVSFGAQDAGVAQGRLPDGAAAIATFPTSASPGRANYLPHGSIVVSEVLTHTDAPLEDAIELQNVGSNSVSIGGWWISNSDGALQKFEIPANTVLNPGQFIVFYENQFNPSGTGTAPSFTLNSAHGDNVYVSAVDTNGTLTGYRAEASFGAAANGVSFGRFVTSVGPDFTAMAARTFGQDNPGSLTQFRTGTGVSNSYPKVGPVIFNEVNYHPVSLAGNGVTERSDEEFIEIHNVTASAVPLYDVARPTNGWSVRGGVNFHFTSNHVIPAFGYLVLVGFDPATNTAAVGNLRAKFGTNGILVGPYSGQLNNAGDVLELYRPDAPQTAPSPDAGFVPQILVDRVVYSDTAPWPLAADGGGASLQRIATSLYGNDPASWKAEPASLGTTNTHVGDIAPTITAQPTNVTVVAGGTASFFVSVAGTAPFSYQWQGGTNNLPGQVGPTLTLSNVQPSQAGTYRVIVTNLAGAIISASATLSVQSAPYIIQPPTNRVVVAGANAEFTVSAGGTAPLYYQWRKNGGDIGGANDASYLILNAAPGDAASYTVYITNALGQVLSSPASLTVIVPPFITSQPLATNVMVNASVSFSVSAGGTAPLMYQWRRNGTNIPGATASSYTIASAQVTDQGDYSVLVSNAGGSLPSAGARLNVGMAPVLAAPRTLANGAFTFSLQGVVNQTYQVDWSSNLTSWNSFTNLTLTNATAPVTDPGASNSPGRYYRARIANP